MIRTEKVESGGQPFVKIFLDDGNGDFSRSHNSSQSSVAGKHVKELFLEHRRDAFGQRRKARMAQHGQLIFAVAINKLCVGKKIKPVLDRGIERAKKPIALERPSFQEFSGFEFSRITEIVN